VGYVPVDRVTAVIDAVMGVQRDYGDRVDRLHARFKYTIDDKGLDWIVAAIEARQGFAFEPARPFQFTSNADVVGWVRGHDGRDHYTLFVENGRIANAEPALMDGLRAIARVHEGTFRLTPNQNIIVAGVTAAARPGIEALLAEHGLAALNRRSA